MNVESQTAPQSSKENSFLRRLNWALALLVFVMAVSVFSVSYTADFVHWDDDINIYSNPHIHGVNAQSLQWMFTDARYIPRYMPLGWLSYAITYQFGELNPVGYHAANIGLHALNSVLVFFLLQRLLRLAAAATGRAFSVRGLLIGSAIAALAWAIHPLRAETVAWASARIYCQATLFVLVSTWSYLRANESTGSTRTKWLAASVITFLASLLTYPIAIGFVCVLILLDYFPLRRFSLSRESILSRATRRVWLEKIPFVAAVVLVAGVTAWARLNSGQYAAPQSLDEFGIGSRVMQSFYVWAHYLGKTLLPLDLCPTYTTLYSFNPFNLMFVGAALLVTGVSCVTLFRIRRAPGTAVLWISYLALLVPMLGLTEHPHYAYDRYSYIASLLGSVVVAWWLAKLWETRARFAACSVAVVALAMCGQAAFNQAARWRDTPTLLNYVISEVGNHPIAAKQEHILGVEYLASRNSAKAIEHLQRALRITPESPDVHATLGDTLADLGRVDEALPHYKEALRIDPAHRTARQNLGVTLGGAGRLDEALEHFRELIRVNTNDVKAHHNAAITLAQLGRKEEAMAEMAVAKQLSGARQ